MRFFALELSLEIIGKLRVLLPFIRRQDRKLFTQISTAASSVSLNLGEGSRRRGNDRTHLFRVAAGSAEEVRTGLRVAAAWGYFDERRARDVLADIDRLQRLLRGLGG